MHGMVHKGISVFVTESFGAAEWDGLCQVLGIDVDPASATQLNDFVATQILFNLAERTNRPKREVMEDYGMFLMTADVTSGIRRLMRFGGADFVEYIDSLEELPGRIRLAIDDFVLPPLTVTQESDTKYKVWVETKMGAFTFVLIGMFRAMADDYGTLCEIKHDKRTEKGDMISIEIFDLGFDKGRDFSLVGAA